MMDRRAFVTMVGWSILAAPLAAESQPAGKVYRMGFLGNSTAALEANLVGHSARACASWATSRDRISSSSIDGRKGSTNGFPSSSRSCSSRRWR